MKRNTTEVGAFGENICKNYLTNKGYNIIESNYYSRYGEIDIIASNDRYLSFVEVKTRSKYSITKGWEAIGKIKIQKIIKTAVQFLTHNNFNLQPRFDVCEVYIIKDLYKQKYSVHNINYIENAFDLNSI